jgi:hypothetical protein
VARIYTSDSFKILARKPLGKPIWKWKKNIKTELGKAGMSTGGGWEWRRIVSNGWLLHSLRILLP